VRTYNCLKKANIMTIGELVQKTEGDLMQIRNFGKKSLNEVKEKLAGFGLSLKKGPAGEVMEYSDEDEESDIEELMGATEASVDGDDTEDGE